jgi:hypothetical protein
MTDDTSSSSREPIEPAEPARVDALASAALDAVASDEEVAELERLDPTGARRDAIGAVRRAVGSVDVVDPAARDRAIAAALRAAGIAPPVVPLTPAPGRRSEQRQSARGLRRFAPTIGVAAAALVAVIGLTQLNLGGSGDDGTGAGDSGVLSAASETSAASEEAAADAAAPSVATDEAASELTETTAAESEALETTGATGGPVIDTIDQLVAFAAPLAQQGDGAATTSVPPSTSAASTTTTAAGGVAPTCPAGEALTWQGTPAIAVLDVGVTTQVIVLDATTCAELVRATLPPP